MQTKSLLALLCFVESATTLARAAACELIYQSLDPVSFDSATKISVIGFSASVLYKTLPPGSDPFFVVTSASEEPVISVDGETITISSGTCEPEDTTNTPESSANMVYGYGATLMSLLNSQSVPSMIFMTGILFWSMPNVMADGHTCMPSMEIEISLPLGTETTSRFGETDHYLAATTETVTWGYYDPNATAQLLIESGDTVTVEVVTHHASHDYAKMIRGDPAIEEIFAWNKNESLTEKNEPKLPGSGVHLVTGPIEVNGAEVGDVLEVEILELDPRLNPVTKKCYGTNSQKFAGYHYNSALGFKRDGTPYVRTGGTEAISVMEFIEDDNSNMLWGKPVYMYRFPNMTLPDGSVHTFDSNPSVVIPHEFNYGYNLELLEQDPIIYPPGFDGFTVTDEGGIVYLSPDPATLDWKVPLRPHLGTLAVLPNNTANYIDSAATGGASTIPPARFGGNIDDWRIGKGGTMFYNVEVPGAMVLVGDTHAAQGDSELAGTAMETSMTAKLKITLHKRSALPKKVATLNFPLLETSEQFVIHGFAYDNYLDQLPDPSTIFRNGTSIDRAMADCFLKTRNWLMDVMDLIEEETIALMSMGVDFGITQVVDGNWGVHADIAKWIFDSSDAPFDYSCTTSKSPGRRSRQLRAKERREMLAQHGVDDSPEEYSRQLYARVAGKCSGCYESSSRHHVAEKLLDAKLRFAHKLRNTRTD